MRARVLLFLGPALAAAGACGAEAPPEARPAAGALPPVAAPPAGPGDVQVASANGRPVWGSCVAAQVARGARTRQAALAACVDFELLAQAAEARGLARAPEVGEAVRAALVGRLVETAFEDRYRAPADLADVIDRVIERNRDQLDKPELRASAFARVEVPAGAPPEIDAAARALAERIAGALAGEAGLFPVHLREAADRLAAEGLAAAAGAGAGLRVTHGEFRLATREGLVPPYADALFAIPEVGRIAAPARTAWGWDVVLLTERRAPRVYTRDEVAARVFPDVRRQYFQLWVNQLARSLGVRIEIDAEQVARLDQEPRP